MNDEDSFSTFCWLESCTKIEVVTLLTALPFVCSLNSLIENKIKSCKTRTAAGCLIVSPSPYCFLGTLVFS